GFNSPLFSYASQNGFINSSFSQKPVFGNLPAQMFNNIPQQSAQFPPPPPSLPFQPQSTSFLTKPSTKGEVNANEISTAKLLNGSINGSKENMDEESTSKMVDSNNLQDDDDDDDEPYLYDDDQLEEQINEYVTYQEEKEQF